MKTFYSLVLLAGVLFFSTNETTAQEWRVGIFNSSLMNRVGVEYQFPNDRFKSEFRLGSDFSSYLEDASIEVFVAYNIVSTERVKFYAGLGYMFTYFEDVVVPIGFEFIPFKENDRFSMVVEIEPTIGDGFLQNSWGFKYRL